MALGDPPKKKPVVQKDYDDCWVPYPDNPKEFEVNTIDGKLRGRNMADFEWAPPPPPPPTVPDAGIDIDENTIIWDDVFPDMDADTD